MNFFSEGKLYQLNDYSLQFNPERSTELDVYNCNRCGGPNHAKNIKKRGCYNCSNGKNMDNYTFSYPQG